MRLSFIPITGLLLLAAAGTGAEDCPTSLSLAQAELAFKNNNPDLQLARRATEAASADVITAGERPNPTLSFDTSSYNVVSGLGPGSATRKQVDSVLRLDQLLERGGKRDLRIGAARHAQRAAQADLADQNRQGLLGTRQAYYDLKLAESKLQINREIAELQNATVTASQQRLHAGDIASADLARLQVEALKAANDVQDSLAELHAAQVALAFLTGCPADTQLVAGDEWKAPADIDGIGDTARFLGDTASGTTRRPDVAAALARREQARSAYDLARAQRVRDITVGAQVEHFPDGVPGNGTGNGDLLLGIGFSIPLFIFSNYDGEIARADADYQSSGDALVRVRAQASAELARARGDLQAATDRARNYRQQIQPQAQVAAEAIEYAYQKGALPLLDLLDARRTLHSIRIDAETAQADYAKALAGWQATTEIYAPGE